MYSTTSAITTMVQRMCNRFNWVALCATVISGLLLSTAPAYAQSGIQVAITADNNYQLCYGTATAVTTCVGANNVWSTTESYTLSGLTPNDLIYIAV